MIPLDPAALLAEVEAAEKERKHHLANAATLIKRFHGNYYNQVRGKASPENMIFSYVAQTLPSIVFDNPVVAVKAKRVVTDEPVAKALALAVNGWIADVRLRDELEHAALDMLLGFGCMKVGLETRGDFAGDPSRGVTERSTMEALTPYAVRISPFDVILDPEASSFAQARFVGHCFSRDLEDLKGDERYDQDAVKRMSGDGEHGRESGRPDRKPGSEGRRSRVTLYELYLPEHRRIATLARYGDGSPAFVRGPEEYHGPDDGPYTLFGVYAVPGKVYPLSPISAMAEQFMDLNAHAVAAAQEAASHKKLAVVSSTSESVAATVHRAETGSVVEIPGFDPQSLANIEIGGTSPARVQYLQVLRDRLDRVVGFSDSQRGRASGVTATEASVVAANDQTRDEFIHLKFRESVKRVLQGVAWYCFYDPSVVMPVTFDDEQTGRSVEGVFLGGEQPGQEDVDFVDFRLEIEPMSMRRVDPAIQAAQATDMIQQAMTIGPAIPQMPWINWKAIMDMLGEANNMPDLASRLLNQQGLAMLQQGVLGAVGPGGFAGQDQGPQQGPPGARGFIGQAAAGEPAGAMPNNLLAAGSSLQQNPAVAAAQQLGYLGGGGGGAGGRSGGAPPM